MRIKRIQEFNINENILSSLFKGVKNIFSSKKTKIESILSKIKKARIANTESLIGIEKQIANLSKDGSSESAFQLNNLNRQARILSSVKDQEIFFLEKEADSIIEDDPKLRAFFASEISKIETEVSQKYLKSAKGYKDPDHLERLNKEFEKLVKDSEKKTEFFQEFENTEDYLKSQVLPDFASDELIKFIDMQNFEAESLIKKMSTGDLKKMSENLSSWNFDLRLEYQNAIDSIKKDIKKAKRSGNDFIIPALEKQRESIILQLKNPINKISYKLNMVEKEIKNRRYGTS